jgi:hypothetical protein
MNKIILGTHLLLSKWGSWGSINLGLPSMSPMFGERALKTPLYSESDPDPELSNCDIAVCHIESDLRAIIIRKYCWRWSTRHFLRQYEWTFNRYCLRLEQSIWAVHTELESNLLICRENNGIKTQTRKVSLKTEPTNSMPAVVRAFLHQE